MLTGQLVTVLWTVIPSLTFANSCLTSVIYAAGMVMVAQNCHIGSRLKAMVIIPGAWWVGSVFGGFTVKSPYLSLAATFNVMLTKVCFVTVTHQHRILSV